MSLTKATYSMIDTAPINVRDYGAIGDGVADDTSAIQAAIDAATLVGASKSVFVPTGTYKVTALSVPEGMNIYGEGVRSSKLIASGNGDIVSVLSNLYLTDIWIDGNGGSGKGFVNPALSARPNVTQMRIENFTDGIGFYDKLGQNAHWQSVFSQFNRNNFKLEQSQNCTLMTCSANMGTVGGNAADRNILMLGAIACRVIGGIYERGATADYCVEIDGGAGNLFLGTELNSAQTAIVELKGVSTFPTFQATFDSVRWTFNSDVLAVKYSGTGIYNVVNPVFTGLNGRLPILTFEGNVLWNGSPDLPIASAHFRSGVEGWAAQGTGTVTWNNGAIDCTGDAVANGARVLPYTNYTTTGQLSPEGRTVKIQMDLADVIETAGGTPDTVSLYITMPGSPFRRLIGSYASGQHEIYTTVGVGEVLAFQVTAGAAVAKSWTIRSFDAWLQ